MSDPNVEWKNSLICPSIGSKICLLERQPKNGENQVVKFLRNWDVTQEFLDIDSTLESCIMRIISLRDFFVTVEYHCQIIVWNQSDFSVHLVIGTEVCTKYDAQTVDTPRDGTTNSIFISRKMDKNTCLEITTYPNLQEPSNCTQKILEFQKVFIKHNVYLESQNSIVLSLCPHERSMTSLIYVYTQDTLEQAWEPIEVRDPRFFGNIAPTVLEDRFLLFNGILYDRGVFKRLPIGYLAIPLVLRPLSMGRYIVLLKRKPVSKQIILFSFDPEANTCQEIEIFLTDEGCRGEKLSGWEIRRLDDNVLLVSASKGTHKVIKIIVIVLVFSC